jgi:hypothetical protein
MNSGKLNGRVRRSHRKSRSHSRSRILRSRYTRRSRSRASRKVKRVRSTSRSLQSLLSRTRQPYLKKILKGEIKKASSGRGIRTRGWRAMSPKPGSNRHYLYQKCGRKCFLGPGESFPVCARCQKGRCSCRIDCRGVASASVRAHQYKHKGIYSKINRLSGRCAL